MKPIQWHLKRHWPVPEVLEKVIPLPKVLHLHLDFSLHTDNILLGQPLVLCHALQLFTDASNEGLDTHLDDYSQGAFGHTEKANYISVFLELKVVLLALKRLEHFCRGKTVLVATDNAMVVSCINNEGGYEVRLYVCTPLKTCGAQIVLRARHII